MQRFNFQILWFGLFWLGFFFFQASRLLTKLSSWENKHWNFPKRVIHVGWEGIQGIKQLQSGFGAGGGKAEHGLSRVK